MRLFIALPLSISDSEHLDRLRQPLRQIGKSVKWVQSDQFHFTLRFLGEVPEDQLESLGDIVRQTAKLEEPISATLSSFGAFPNLHRPRVMWAGVGSGKETLIKIARELESRLVHRFGPADKPFKPHLTIGRVREGAHVSDLATRIEQIGKFSLSITLTELVLFASTLTPTGPHYRKWEAAQLARSNQSERFI